MTYTLHKYHFPIVLKTVFFSNTVVIKSTFTIFSIDTDFPIILTLSCSSTGSMVSRINDIFLKQYFNPMLYYNEKSLPFYVS